MLKTKYIDNVKRTWATKSSRQNDEDAKFYDAKIRQMRDIQITIKGRVLKEY